MRKQLLSVFLPLLVLVLFAAAAQTQSTGTEATKDATLQKVNVVRGDDGISVEITARGQVRPQLSTLASPARVVVDLPNTVAATAQNHISVDNDGVKGVRVGMDGRTPPTTRLVIDLVQACRYELVPGGDNKLILKLHTAASAAKAIAKPLASAAPKAAAALTVPPAVAKKEVTVSQLAPTAAAPVEDKKSSQGASSATDFVFVEPSYKPKDATAEEENKAAVIEPSARAIAAAGKFADKPEGNLLPTPSASMQPQAAQAAASSSQPAVNMAAEQKAQAQQAPAINGPKYTGEPISVNLKDVDLKDFFRLIHEISGLNVVLDPTVKGSLTIVLDDVPWDQALD